MKKLHIVYTDDDEDDKLIFSNALSEVDKNVELTTADDGEQLLKLLRNGSDPEMIFLDLNMPRTNGYQALQTIRTDANLRHHKVIVFSTSSDPAAIARTRELGADRFVIKPRSYGDIKQVIRTCIGLDWANKQDAETNYLIRLNKGE